MEGTPPAAKLAGQVLVETNGREEGGVRTYEPYTAFSG